MTNLRLSNIICARCKEQIGFGIIPGINEQTTGDVRSMIRDHHNRTQEKTSSGASVGGHEFYTAQLPSGLFAEIEAHGSTSWVQKEMTEFDYKNTFYGL